MTTETETDHEFQIVERPIKVSSRRSIFAPLSQALLDTVANGKAVHISSSSRPWPNIRNSLAHFCKTRELLLKTAKDDTGYIVWAVPADPTTEPAV